MLNQFSQAKWADFTEDKLHSLEGVQPLQMQHSDGTALPLVVDDSKEQRFGADIVRFASGTGVGLHTHVGSHILMVTKGNGLLTYGDEKHEMFPGMIYLIPSNTPHSIEAITELVLVAVGNDHRPADSEERLEIVNTEEKNNE
jgi:quercetin dioxygenase-like cupin family protein